MSVGYVNMYGEMTLLTARFLSDSTEEYDRNEKCRYTAKWTFPNTGLLAGAKNRSKFICLTGNMTIQLTHISIKCHKKNKDDLQSP